jgi:hypothetical protein
MKKPAILFLMLFHKYAFSAVVATGAGMAAAGVSAAAAGANTSHFFNALLAIVPEVWALSTFGAVFVYMNHKVAKRNRLLNLALSIILGAFGSDVSASYVRKTFELDSAFLTPILALLIAGLWPWVFEKLLRPKK